MMNKMSLTRAIATMLIGASLQMFAADELEQNFKVPPRDAQAWCIWWWINGNASKEGITRDMEEMKRQGISGALLFDAGEADTKQVPRGPAFMSDGWRELYKHALAEANRCGIVLTVNLCSGWDAGGPWVTPEHAAKKLVSVETVLKNPGTISVVLPKLPTAQARDIVVLAQPVLEAPQKPAENKKADAPLWLRSRAVDVTGLVQPDGTLTWQAPAGQWRVVRFGYTLHGMKTVCVGSGPVGLEIDPMSAEAMDLHFAQTGAKLIADAGPLAGKALQYFHIDSWEIGQPTWTAKLPDEFKKRRGYDLLPWLPALRGETVDTPQETTRFVQDYRRTIADLVAQNYYGRMAELTVKGGLLGTHSESGGPNQHWIDALQCQGKNAVPMGEFWNRVSEPDGRRPLYGDHNYTVKGAASAAHIYGKPVCQAEAFTSLADDFAEDPWCMKDIGDEAFCDGLTRMVFHNWPTHSKPDLKPGYWWGHIGVHFGYNLTWWPMADGWLTYLARCQYMLRQGSFVADFAYLQSETIPAFPAKSTAQKPMRPAGFDYDVINAEALLTRAAAKEKRLTLPDGMSYRYLVLPPQTNAILSNAALKKINELAEAGVPILGPTHLAAAVPRLRVATPPAAVTTDGLAADIEFRGTTNGCAFEWIHRRDGETEIYFISNKSATNGTTNVLFRVKDKQPELWDAVTGKIRVLPDYKSLDDGRTEVPLVFASRQSWFVVFRRSGQPPAASSQPARNNFPALDPVQEIAGAWEVQFDPQWFYPDNGSGGKLRFDHLTDWTHRPEEAIKFYSGIATYSTTFDLQSSLPKSKIVLDLGLVKNVARVQLNGRDLGVVWTAPWQVEIPAGVLKENRNELTVAVANLWPNRLIGDGRLPNEQRRTVTNIQTYAPLMSKEGWVPTSTWARHYCPQCQARLKSGQPADLTPSGLLGPVQVMQETDGGDASGRKASP